MNLDSKTGGNGTWEKVFNLLYKALELVSGICLAGQVIIITIAVVGRYVFSKTPPWAEEVSRILMIWMAMLTASMAVKDDTHVRITFLDKLFGETGLKIRDIVYTVMNIAFCLVLFWNGLTLSKQQARTKLPGSGWPSSVLYASVCVGGLCMALMLIYQLGVKIWHRKQ